MGSRSLLFLTSDFTMNLVFCTLLLPLVLGGYVPECKTVFEEKCWDEPREQCKSVQKPYTTVENKEECSTKYEDVCKTVHDTKVEYVPREECRTEQEKKCHTQTKQECDLVQVPKTHTVPEMKCEKVPKQKCHTETEQQGVPY